MAVLFDSHRLIVPVAPLVGVVVGACTAAILATVPTVAIETAVLNSGLATIVPAATAPFGGTARSVLVLLGGGALGIIGWFASFLALGHRRVGIGAGRATMDGRTSPDEVAPTLRRADAHPDAPSRRLLRADRDLGTRFLDIPVPSARHLDAQVLLSGPEVAVRRPEPAGPLAERALPKDLDQPLAAYADGALPGPPPPTFSPTERPRTVAPTPTRADPSETIHALLDRLEQVAQRPPVERVAVPPQDRLEDTLAALRAMAQRAH